jgi:ankyrin repeat protein
MWAAKQGHFQVVDVLTKKSTDINMCDMRGYTALLIAAKNKRWDVTKLLSQRGGNVKTCDWSGSNVLHFAAESGPTEFVAYLLDMGQIDIECRNKYEQTPLWLAARSGRLEVTQLLLEHRANLYVQDMKGCTPLHVAAAGGHLHIVQVLLQHDARPSV